MLISDMLLLTYAYVVESVMHASRRQMYITEILVQCVAV
jgi:hypothetical protein